MALTERKNTADRGATKSRSEAYMEVRRNDAGYPMLPKAEQREAAGVHRVAATKVCEVMALCIGRRDPPYHE
jgi:hypothetical protein